MDGYGVGASSLGSLRLAQEGDIVGSRGLLQIFKPYIHRANLYTQFFKAGEEVEQMVGCEGKFGRLDMMRCEGQVRAGEGGRESTRG